MGILPMSITGVPPMAGRAKACPAKAGMALRSMGRTPMPLETMHNASS